MTEISPFAYPSNGKVIICGDGPEILVYSGNDDGPLWKQFLTDVIVGVGVTADDVYALEAGGRLVKMRLVNGEVLSEDFMEMEPTGLLISHDSVMAITFPDRVLIRHPGREAIVVMVADVRVIAFGPDGQSMGIGTGSGEFCAIETMTGGEWGRVSLGGAVSGICWCAQQQWLVSSGNELHSIRGDGGTIVETIPVGGIVDCLACSNDGSVVAILTNGSHIRIYEWLNKRQAGDIWFQRKVQHLCFGPSGWLGIGHDEGDANRVDLFTGEMTRTLAHPGRGQHSWPMQVEVNHSLLRGSSTALRAGSAPIAIQVRSPENEKKRGRIWLLLIFLLAFLILCCGVFGVCNLSGWAPKVHFLW
jgi:hypothetical protein